MSEDTCPGNNGQPHQPDWGKVKVESDGGEWYLDFNCVWCGRPGCVGTTRLTNIITWEV